MSMAFSNESLPPYLMVAHPVRVMKKHQSKN